MPSALAVAAHPDDIEFVMAGTLLQLRAAGWEIHYLNLSTGNLGSLTMAPVRTARVRRAEAQAAAKVLGAVWHPPMCNDLEIAYDTRTLRRLCAVVRDVRPSVILTHALEDYMEDHMNAARLAVSAAFAREMPGFSSNPPRRPAQGPVTLYHANPHGLRDRMRQRIMPGAFVDTAGVQETKRDALACHTSQGTFLDATQSMNGYLNVMDRFSREVGRLSRRFRHAEGWRRHLHYGFCEESADPLRTALGRKYLVNAKYERGLEQYK